MNLMHILKINMFHFFILTFTLFFFFINTYLNHLNLQQQIPLQVSDQLIYVLIVNFYPFVPKL